MKKRMLAAMLIGVAVLLAGCAWRQDPLETCRQSFESVAEAPALATEGTVTMAQDGESESYPVRQWYLDEENWLYETTQKEITWRVLCYEGQQYATSLVRPEQWQTADGYGLLAPYGATGSWPEGAEVRSSEKQGDLLCVVCDMPLNAGEQPEGWEDQAVQVTCWIDKQNKLQKVELYNDFIFTQTPPDGQTVTQQAQITNTTQYLETTPEEVQQVLDEAFAETQA